MNRSVFLNSRPRNVTFITEDSEDLSGQLRYAGYAQPSVQEYEAALQQLTDVCAVPVVINVAQTIRIYLIMDNKEHEEAVGPLTQALCRLTHVFCNQHQQLSPDPTIEEALYQILWAVNVHQLCTTRYYSADTTQALSLLAHEAPIRIMQLMTRITINCSYDIKDKNEKPERFLDDVWPLRWLTPTNISRIFCQKFTCKHETRFYLRTVFELIRQHGKKSPVIETLVRICCEYLGRVVDTEAASWHFSSDCFNFLLDRKEQAHQFGFKYLKSPNLRVSKAAADYLDQGLDDLNVSQLSEMFFTLKLMEDIGEALAQPYLDVKALSILKAVTNGSQIVYSRLTVVVDNLIHLVTSTNRQLATDALVMLELSDYVEHCDVSENFLIAIDRAVCTIGDGELKKCDRMIRSAFYIAGEIEVKYGKEFVSARTANLIGLAEMLAGTYGSSHAKDFLLVVVGSKW